MKLSIVIPCSDTKGASISLQSLLLYHANIVESLEILIVGPRAVHKWLADYVEPFPNCRFIDFRGKSTPSCLLNAAIATASYQHVLCVQPDCFLEFGVIERLLEFYNSNPNSLDLFQGPLVQGKGKFLQVKPWQTHDMFRAIADEVKRGTAFEIEVQDLGVFSCRRDAWPGINELFRTFDGSGYIHDKFRARGSRCFCLPWFNWSRPPIITVYPIDDQVHDYALWCAETGRDPREIFNQIDVEYSEAMLIYEHSRFKHKLAPLYHSVVAPAHSLISCVTIVGDSSDYALNECIESFRRQTYPRRELVIVNDRDDRRIDIKMPLVKVVDILDLRPEAILTITSGEFICLWSPDRVPYPTKLSLMMTHLVEGCSWTDEYLDMGFRRNKLSPTILLTRAALASVVNDTETIDDVVARFAQLHRKLPFVQDIQGDTTCPWEKGDKLYRLKPFWFNPKYEKISTSFGSAYRKVKSITAFLLMFNLLEWPLAMIAKLQELKIRVVLVDQGSTYQPLLDYYDKCDLDLRKLSHPISRSEFIVNSGIPAEFCAHDEFFLVVDNDLDLSELPDDIVKTMVKTIRDYGGPAAGLKIGPEQEYKATERPRYWDKLGGDALFSFTMYRLGTKIRSVPQKRVPDCIIQHLPWNVDVAKGLSEELLYYVRQRLLFSKAADPRLIDEYLALVEETSDDS